MVQLFIYIYLDRKQDLIFQKYINSVNNSNTNNLKNSDKNIRC